MSENDKNDPGAVNLEHVLEALTALQESLEAFRSEDRKHHESVSGTLNLLIEDKREQATRLTALELRVARLEQRGDK